MISIDDLINFSKYVNLKKILQVLVTIMALMLLVFVSAFVTLKIMTWGETVDVPDIRGQDLSAVVNLLGENGLEVNVERQEHHPDLPANSVISQFPAPGANVKKGRSVSVTVSLGSEEVNVPFLKGEALKRAQILLDKAGLVLGEVARVNSPEPRNTVMAQYPPGETVVQKGARVDLLVCNGPQPVKFVTPDLDGKTIRQAEALTRSMALRLVSGGRGNKIVSQNPEPGVQISAGSSLYVTLGRN